MHRGVIGLRARAAAMISSEGKITIISAKIGVNSEALVMNKVKISIVAPKRSRERA